MYASKSPEALAMDSIDRKLVAQAEKGLPVLSEPFNQIAAETGITPQQAIQRLKQLREEGVIRRFGVSLRPISIGYAANAVVAWKVPEERVCELGAYFAGYKDISHCYEREVVAGRWEYNLYTVIHGRERTAVEELVKLLALVVGIADYVVLFSTKNLKNSVEEKRQC